jgi:sterol carrier protein 2
VKPEVTIIVNDNDVVDLIVGKLNPQRAFFQGKVKIKGNMGLALKLTSLLSTVAPTLADVRSKL